MNIISRVVHISICYTMLTCPCMSCMSSWCHVHDVAAEGPLTAQEKELLSLETAQLDVVRQGVRVLMAGLKRVGESLFRLSLKMNATAWCCASVRACACWWLDFKELVSCTGHWQNTERNTEYKNTELIQKEVQKYRNTKRVGQLCRTHAKYMCASCALSNVKHWITCHLCLPCTCG